MKVNYEDPIQHFIRQRNLGHAYALAALGTTQEGLKQLGLECLRRGDLRLARKSFQRRNDFRAISMLNYVQVELDSLNLTGERQQHVCSAYAYASAHKFTDAAEEWAKAGRPQRACEMFSDLRRYACWAVDPWLQIEGVSSRSV